MPGPSGARRDPHICRVPEQLDLLLFPGAEPARHALRGDVLAIDAGDGLREVERSEGPVDCRACGFARIALALACPGDAPADLEIRPAGRKPGAHPSDE